MMDVLDPDRIGMQLGTRALGRHVLVFESTASTHDIAAAYAAQAKHHGWVILAEQQEQGRGRGGHRWVSGRGDSVLCSVVLTECDLLPDLLSLCTAVAVAEAVGPARLPIIKLKSWGSVSTVTRRRLISLPLSAVGSPVWIWSRVPGRIGFG